MSKSIKNKEVTYKERIILEIIKRIRESLDDIEDTIKNYETDAYDITQAIVIIRKVWDDSELVSDMIWN